MNRSRVPSRLPASGAVARTVRWVAAVAAFLAPACTPASGPLRLEVGAVRQAAAPAASARRQIRGGEKHPQTVQLEAGQFLRAVVEQDGIDVEVLLLDPDGKEVQKVDAPEVTYWDEELAVVAARSGPHHLIVRSFSESAPPGRFTLRIEGPRPATEADRLRVEAIRLTQEATDQMSTRTVESRRRQVQLRKQALALWQRLGDRQREAEALYQLGALRLKLGEREAASDLLNRAASGLSEPVQRALVLNEAGHAACQLARFQEAKSHFEAALPLARQAKDRRLQFDVLNNLGRLHDELLGEPRAALTYLTAALTLSREMQDAQGEASALINLGAASDNLSDGQRAIQYYSSALELARVQKLRDEATALNNLGETYRKLGMLREAVDHFQQALELNRKHGDRNHEAKTLNNLGVAYEKSGRTQEAFDAYQSALALAQEIGNPDLRDLQAMVLANLGALHLLAGQNEKALESCTQALPLAANRETEAKIRHILGRIQRQSRDLTAARETLEKALELSRENPGRTADITLLLARVASDAGDLDRAAELARKAIEVVEEVRNRLLRKDLQESFFASKQDFYEFYVDVLMQLERRNPGAGFAAQALEQNERARARSLLDILAEAGAEIRRWADPGLLAQERELRADIGALDRLRRELAGRPDARPKGLAEAEAKLEKTLALYRHVEDALRRSSPRYMALTRPEPLRTEQIQEQVLDGDMLLLEYALGKRRSYLWAVTRDAVSAFELPPRSAIDAVARRLYELLTERNRDRPGEDLAARKARHRRADAEAEKAAAELAQIVLGPVEPLLENQPLLVVSDGALQYIPFAALPLPSRREHGKPVLVIQNHEVVSLPSASALAVLRQELADQPAPEETVAVLADPVFQPDDPRLATRLAVKPAEPAPHGKHRGALDLSKLYRLVGSGEEARVIAELVPPAESFKAVSFDASLATATSGKLARYRFVHFATHGLLDSEHPELSSLVLSLFNERGERQEGQLRLADVYNLQLNADLVALSACETALGKEVRGEGLVGLTRGFMYAGSARVLATLWKVQDRPTLQLMKSFYRGILVEGLSASAALRRAQLEALGEPYRRSPYFWAGFTLQGEPR